jgi:uncharacterized small protein (DUF1192 family)
MFAKVVFALLLASAGASVQNDAKNRPVSKVITLLNDMVKQLEKEAKEDEETYETMDCWCTTNDKGKTQAIADGESTIEQLTAAIQSYTALSSKLNTDIGNLEAELSANNEALEKATAVRKKELAEFNAEEKSSLSTIASLKGAIGKLAKHHDAAFLQSENAEETMGFAKVVADLHMSVKRNGDLLNGMLTKRQRKSLTAFLQSPDNFVDSGLIDSGLNLRRPTAFVQAAPSAEIFGTLKQMKEGFESNLAASQAEEMKSQAEYEGVKKGKENEIAAGQSQIDTKTSELADTDSKNAESKKMLAETRATLAADTEFLGKLKEQCALFAKEYAERTSTRQLEITAVGKALAFLSSDEAQDLVSRTFSFVQTSLSKSDKARRSKVADKLSSVAKKFNDPRISTLAVRARLDAFTKVKASISDMIAQLAKEQEEEVQHKDFCVDEINANEKETQEKEQAKGTLEVKIQDLTEKIDSLNKLIAELKAEIADLQLQLKRASEDREAENSLFQTTVADQRATQKLLAGALNILKGFYDKAALLQKSAKQEPAGPPPPPGFKSYENNAQSGGVMGMIQMIIDDAKAMETDALKAEEESQIAYEVFVTETNASIDAATKESITSAENKAKAEEEKSETELSRDGVDNEIMALIGENGDLHKSCDYTLKNFDLRQAARQSEMEALKQALSILSGASFSAFLQGK